ncbi:MAG: hypothetical protein IT370_27450 [Deltaproteobacteria bacterium]|nr:hypothetical protein [Deltaproteobacteria bacterium]
MKLRALARGVGLAALVLAASCKREPAGDGSRTGAGSRASAPDAGAHPLAGQAYSTWTERPGVCSLDFWCWYSPVPQGQVLRAGWAVPGSADEAWLVGAHTTLLHLRGQEVTSVPTEVDVTLRGIWGSSARDVWAVGDDLVLHGDGVTWVRATLPGAGKLVDVWGTGPRDVWFAGEGVVWHYDGTRFEARTPPSCAPQRLAGGDGDGPWLLCSSAAGRRLLRWEGAWREVTGVPGGPVALLAAAGQVWLVGEQLWRWDGQQLHGELLDAGQHGSALALRGDDLLVLRDDLQVLGDAPDGPPLWTRPLAGGPLRPVRGDGVARRYQAVVSAATPWLLGDGELLRLDAAGLRPHLAPVERLRPRSLWGSRGDDVWAVAGWRRHWDGKQWSPSEGVGLQALWGGSSVDVWAVGASAQHWDGKRWRVVPAPGDGQPQPPLTAVHGSGSKDVWAVGEGRLPMRWDGTAWRQFAAPEGEDGLGMLAVWARSPSAAWLVGRNGRARRWDGEQWRSVDSGTRSDLYGLFGVGDDLWAVGDGGTILRWQAERWVKVASPTTASLRAVWGPRGKELWAVGDVVLKWDGKAWTVSPLRPARQMGALWGPGRDDAWMGGDGGLLRRLAYPD